MTTLIVQVFWICRLSFMVISSTAQLSPQYALAGMSATSQDSFKAQ
jgi:hypothetical protein